MKHEYLTVRRDHIDTCEPDSCMRCAIANMLHDEGYKDIFVTLRSVSFERRYFKCSLAIIVWQKQLINAVETNTVHLVPEIDIVLDDEFRVAMMAEEVVEPQGDRNGT